MSGLYTVAATVCGCCIVVALLSRFVSDGGTQKLLSMVIGAFIVCAMLVPAVRAVKGVALNGRSLTVPANEAATADEAVNHEVLLLTKQNLETALCDILSQNGYPIQRAEVVLALADDTRVVIATITLTVDTAYRDGEKRIADITERHFTVRPHIVWE